MYPPAFPVNLCVLKENGPEDRFCSVTTVPPQSRGQPTSSFPSFSKLAFLTNTTLELSAPFWFLLYRRCWVLFIPYLIP